MSRRYWLLTFPALLGETKKDPLEATFKFIPKNFLVSSIDIFVLKDRYLAWNCPTCLKPPNIL